MGVLINILHVNGRGYTNSNLEMYFNFRNTIITNTILKEIKYLLENEKFSNNIKKAQIYNQQMNTINLRNYYDRQPRI